VVQGVQGDVTITVDQSGGTAVAKKPAAAVKTQPSPAEKPSQ
jgi:hypothetical protein